MTIAEMLGQSGILTLLGMCVVFSFLIILIISMYLLHYVVHALHLDKDLEKKETKSVSVAVPTAQVSVPASDTGAIIAAIAVAVREKQSV